MSRAFVRHLRQLVFLVGCPLWVAETTGFAAAPEPLPNWRLELVASAPTVRHPSVVACAPDGRIFVAEDPMDIRTPRADAQEGRILCVHPDGRVTVFADRLHAVFGLQYLEGRVYALHNPKFSVWDDVNGVGTNRVDLIEQTNPNPWALDWNDHIPANFRLAMDGYFYVAVGDKGLFGARGTDGRQVNLHGGGVVRLRPDGTGLEVFSTGVRNILDVAVNADDDLFTFDNTDEHDWMGRVTHMIDGGFYGYPHDFVPRRPYTLWCFADVGAGAACGALAYEDDALPPDHRGNLFLSDFGKRQILRARLERVGGTYRVPGAGTPVATLNDVEQLFPNPPEDFRPVGIAFTPDGRSLLICDWQHRDVKNAAAEVGRLWKLTWTGRDHSAPRPAWWRDVASGRPVAVPQQELVAALGHPAHSVRLTAQRALARQTSAAPALRQLTADEKAGSRARIHALWAAGTNLPLSDLTALVRSPDTALDRQVVRLLAERPSPDAERVLGDVVAQRRGEDATALRLHAATSLGRSGGPAAVPTLLAALDEPDLFTRHALFTALNRIGRRHPEAWNGIVVALAQADPRRAEGASFALRETYEEPLLAALVALVREMGRPESVRRAALELVAALHHQPPEWKGEWWAYHPALQPPPPRTRVWTGTETVHRTLLAALSDSAPAVRLTAVAGLREFGAAAPEFAAADAAVLRQRFGVEPDSTVRVAVLETLVALKDRETATLLPALLEPPVGDPALLAAAVRATGKLGAINLDSALLKLVNATATADFIREAAVEALGELKAQMAVPTLVWLLNPDTGAPTALGRAAVRALARIGDDAAVAALVTVFQHPAAELRAEAIGVAGRLKRPEFLAPLLARWREADTKAAALGALAQFRDVRALDALVEGLASPNPALREQCREALKPLRDDVLATLEARAPQLSAGVLGELQTVYADHAKARTGPLFATRAAEVADYERHALARPGDPVRGQRVFFDADGVACLKCHAVAGLGATVGPDLTLIGAQFGRRELIEAVLYPSRSVREGYQQYLIELRDGDSLAGAIRAENADTLTLFGADARLTTVRKADIVSRHASQNSIMPEGLHAGLSPAQFTDLIAYLESRRSDPRQPVAAAVPEGFQPLFNGRDTAGWRELPDGTKRVDAAALLRGRPPEHWQAVNGVLEHDGRSGDLWTAREFGDFELRLEWRWPDEPKFEQFPVIGADSYEVKDAAGKAVTERVLDAGDSGVLVRGLYKAQANLFCYPVGSGESWEYRTDLELSEAVRRGVTPKRAADRPIGDWNELRLTVRGTRLTVWLNGEEVISEAELPGLPERGPIGLQHEHGRIQFRHVWVREL